MSNQWRGGGGQEEPSRGFQFHLQISGTLLRACKYISTILSSSPVDCLIVQIAKFAETKLAISSF